MNASLLRIINPPQSPLPTTTTTTAKPALEIKMRWSSVSIFRNSSLFWYMIGAFLVSQVIIIFRFHAISSSEDPLLHPSAQHRGGVGGRLKQSSSASLLQRIAKKRVQDAKKHSTRNVHGSSVIRETTKRTTDEENGPTIHDNTNDDIQQIARRYAEGFTRLGRGPLNFFHIPKTAGTAVEEAAARKGVPWGSCRFSHRPRRDICPYPTGPDWPQHVGWWHLPAYLFPLAGSDPYRSTDLFAIVRDPYDRMVSEFYYTCTLKIKDWRPDQCDNRTRLFDASYMNQWLVRKLRTRANTTTAAAAAYHYLADNSHFTPQHQFVVGPHGVRVVDVVLRMDDPHLSLAEQFARLVRAYGMSPYDDDMTLSYMTAISAGERNTTEHLTVDHLQQSTLDWIHRHYQDDLDYFGYAKMGNKG